MNTHKKYIQIENSNQRTSRQLQDSTKTNFNQRKLEKPKIKSQYFVKAQEPLNIKPSLPLNQYLNTLPLRQERNNQPATPSLEILNNCSSNCAGSKCQHKHFCLL